MESGKCLCGNETCTTIKECCEAVQKVLSSLVVLETHAYEMKDGKIVATKEIK